MDTTILFALIACCLIGVVIGAAIGVEIFRELLDVPEDMEVTDRRTCDNCRHRKKSWNEDPCVECANGDIDRWEPL